MDGGIEKLAKIFKIMGDYSRLGIIMVISKAFHTRSLKALCSASKSTVSATSHSCFRYTSGYRIGMNMAKKGC